MADVVNNALAKKNAQHEPQIIAGHDPSDYLFGIAVKVHIDAEQTAQKTAAHRYDGGRNQQGSKRFNGFDHFFPETDSHIQKQRIHMSNLEMLKGWIEKGMRFVTFSSDVDLLARAAAESISALKKGSQ
jgi:hypothetical protein